MPVDRTIPELYVDNPVVPAAGVKIVVADASGNAGAMLTTTLLTTSANEINALATKATVVGADKIVIEDSAASWAKKGALVSGVNGCAMACATSRTNFTPTAATVDGNFTGIDNALAKVAPITVSVANEYTITENTHTVTFDAAGATPALRPGAANTIDNGELALPWLTVRAATFDAIEGGVRVLTAFGGALQYDGATKGSFIIEQLDAAAGQTAATFTTSGGTGGAASGATAPAGGLTTHRAGAGGAGDGTYAAGAGGAMVVTGGAAGANGGGGGANGGNATIRGGAATGAGTAGSVKIGDANTSSIASGSGTTEWAHAGYLSATLYMRLAAASAPSAVAGTGALYAFTDGSETELGYEDAAGNDVQITRDGYVNTNRGGRALGTSTFTIDSADDGRLCFWTGTSTGVAGTIAAGRAYQVTTLVLTGTAGTITLTASGITLEAGRGKTLTTQAPGASTTVTVTIMYDSTGTYATATGDLA